MEIADNFELSYNVNQLNISEFLNNEDISNKDQVTKPILSKYELAKLLFVYANLINTNVELEFLGHKLNDEDPIINACDLIMERFIPFILKRDVLFNKTKYEVFDISKMYFNINDVRDIKRYLVDNKIPLTDTNPEKILKLINENK